MTDKTGKNTKSVNQPQQASNDDFEIVDEFKNLLPALNRDDKRKLKESILKDGCRDKLICWKEKKQLVDGHHRFEICNEHNLPYEIEWKSFKNRDEAVAWVLDNQKGRRNLNKFQWAEVVLGNKTSIAATAKARQRAGNRSGYQKSDKVVHTIKELAKLAGVSHDTMHKIETILKATNADPANERLQRQVDQLRKGAARVSINAVYEALKETKDKKKPTASKQPIPMSKAKKAVLKDITTQIKSVLATIDDADLKGTQADDRSTIYTKIIEWAKAKISDAPTQQ